MPSEATTNPAPLRAGPVGEERKERGSGGGPDREIRRLNSLRGLAALVVVVSHYSNETHLWGSLAGEGAGQLGVMLFFLLSGFLMSHLYFGLPPGRQNLRAYAAARAARVLPLFYAVCLASFAACRWAPKAYRHVLYRIDTPGSLLSHLLFLHGTSVLWTISPEVHFYVLFALAWALWGSRFRPAVPLLAALALVAALRWGGKPTDLPLGGLVVTPSILQALPLFVIGAVLGRLYARRERLERFRHHGFAAALLLLPLLFPKIFTRFAGYEPNPWRDPIVLTAMVAIFFAVVFLTSRGNRVLENRVGDFYGRISYSLYLLHLPVLAAMARRPWSRGPLGLVIFTGAATAVAYLSFLAVESPSRRFWRRILGAKGSG